MRVTRSTITRLPKVELHSHIDGSVPAKELLAIAKRNRRKIISKSGKEIDTVRELDRHFEGGGYGSLLEEILDRFYPIIGLMQTEEILRDVALAYIEEMSKSNVAYAEGRFAPQYHTAEGLSLEQVIASVAEGLREGEEKFGVKTNLIVAIAREGSARTAEAVARAAIRSRRAVALDLGGAEAGNPPEKFRSAFELAKKGGLNRTVHAGEGAGSIGENLSNVRTAINVLKAERVGHAVHLSRDASLVALVRERKIGIEMNPISNLVLKKINRIADLKIDFLIKSGVLVTINSDDPALWPKGTIVDALSEVCSSYGFGIEGLDRLTANAIQASFASEEEKKSILEDFRRARNRG